MARKFFIQVIVALLTSVSVGVPALASGENVGEVPPVSIQKITVKYYK
jgi:hypothetical protein